MEVRLQADGEDFILELPPESPDRFGGNGAEFDVERGCPILRPVDPE